jgi:hypothetical protein
MKITAFILALNEEFWLDLQLKHIYDFFDEIIIIEGTEIKSNGFGVPKEYVSKDGLSIDRTKEVIESFNDDKNKIKYIRHGFCNDKTELCNIAYNESKGDYVWQIDADEFYTLDMMKNIKNYLTTNNINQINFRMFFFLDFHNCIHGKQGAIWGDNIDICRIFRKEQGNRFNGHRPPSINYKNNGRVIKRDESLANGWVMYHYGYVFDWQIERKSKFYPDGGSYKVLWDQWKRDHNKPFMRGSRTRLFKGQQPEIITSYLEKKI